jgi:hypothetical protein
MGRFDASALGGRAPAEDPTVNFGLVFRQLQQYGNFVHACAESGFVAQTDFTYAAPIYKGSDAIKQGLEVAQSALDKFDVYFLNAVLDDNERSRFSKLFAKQYLAKYPGSERSDLFLASGDILKFAIELLPPLSLSNPMEALKAIEATPHDPAILGKLRGGQAIDRAHLRATMKLFLDHVMNPRRREVPAVADAAAEMGTEDPYVIEVITDGAMPGYVHWVLTPLVRAVGGRLVLLEEG